MKVRKLQYAIDYIHILTFREQYKSLIAPYFDYDRLEYAIDNENTLNEFARLIFPIEGFAIQVKKEGVAFVYEGDISLVRKSNPILDIFFDIYINITKFENYSKTVRHRMTIDTVAFKTEEEVNASLESNSYLKNPFGKLKEFATVFVFDKNNKEYKLQFGNYHEGDIKKHDLSPLKTEYNKELFDKHGFMCQTTVVEPSNTANFTKFKSLITDIEEITNLYLED